MDILMFQGTTLLYSVLAGLIGSLLGLGGGVVLVPVLTVLQGVNIHYAIGASIVSVIATSSGAAAAYVRDHITNLRIAMLLELGTTTGAITGAFIGLWLNGAFLSVVFGLVLAYSGLLMFRHRNAELPTGVRNSPLATRLHLGGEYYDPSLGRTVHYGVTRVPWGLAFNYLAGIVSGLLGIGSGAFKVLAMDTVMRLPMKVSTATSNFMIGVTAAASAVIYLRRGFINPYISAPVAVGVLAGSLVGSRIMTRLKSSALKKGFVVVLAVLAAEMVMRGIQGLS